MRAGLIRNGKTSPPLCRGSSAGSSVLKRSHVKIMRAEARSQSVIFRVALSILPTPTHSSIDTCPPSSLGIALCHGLVAFELGPIPSRGSCPPTSASALTGCIYLYIPSGLFVNVGMQGRFVCAAGVHVCERVWGGVCGRGGVGGESTLVVREGRGRGRVECDSGGRGAGRPGSKAMRNARVHNCICCICLN